jgi:hypothetical protein
MPLFEGIETKSFEAVLRARVRYAPYPNDTATTIPNPIRDR